MITVTGKDVEDVVEQIAPRAEVSIVRVGNGWVVRIDLTTERQWALFQMGDCPFRHDEDRARYDGLRKLFKEVVAVTHLNPVGIVAQAYDALHKANMMLAAEAKAVEQERHKR